jgi:type III secretion protein C
MEQGNNIIIHSNPKVNSPSNIQLRGSKNLPPEAQLVTRVFHLNSFDPEKAAGIIAPLLSGQAILEPLSETSHLIVTDLVVNVNKIAELLKGLDQPAQGLMMGQYTAQNVYADALALLAEKIIVPLADSKPIRFIPFRETNLIYVISTEFFVEKSIEILQEIDRGAKSKADALSGLVGQQFLG